jgi:hypothetical protein
MPRLSDNPDWLRGENNLNGKLMILLMKINKLNPTSSLTETG